MIKVGISSIAAALTAYRLALGETTTVAFASLAVVIARTLDKLDGYFSIIEKLGLISRKIEDVIIE
ncbi:hypothetical protein I6F65_03340 [Pseudoalteromonas sp. SWXJZ94C]|uniref:hypothetical protein n=1 Tax=Pseudoalteromonas sp. SWXJZ94C TaxID=2792065 RepID=UPI0018CE47B0|nr:hypothetical protein [Pseudoalteromonas sp. SWXJZ94C]MBH0055985.1 hypothetical protein [Pseudoalteromonas sp. SWXJZ94C]